MRVSSPASPAMRSLSPSGPDADQAAPAFEWGAATGFDSGDSRCLSQIERTIRTAVERNSLCQFWKLSNQSWGSARQAGLNRAGRKGRLKRRR